MGRVSGFRRGGFQAALLVCTTIAAVAATHFAVSQPPRSSSDNPPPAGAAPRAGGKLATFDQALQILNRARQAYQGVRDYTCTFAKQEVIDGQLAPENITAMKVRSQPFSVYLKWQAPKSVEGQECCYVPGKNGGMMRVKSVGLLAGLGFLSLDINDPRARATSRHPITEAGIGALIERLAKRWPEEQGRQRTQVIIGEYEFAHRRCTRVETVNPNTRPGEFYCYRSVIYFDQETKLPIRAEAYGWPRERFPDGERFEVYSYLDLRFNVGLTDADFNY